MDIFAHVGWRACVGGRVVKVRVQAHVAGRRTASEQSHLGRLYPHHINDALDVEGGKGGSVLAVLSPVNWAHI